MDDPFKTDPARMSQIEDDVAELKGDVGSLKADFKLLGNTVKGLSEDIAASDRKQESYHLDTVRRQELFQKEWRDQKDAERREQEQFRRSRQLGPLQVLQIAATGVAIMVAAFGGFFFLVKAYVDGSLTPQITQLTERQNASTQGAVVRNDIMDGMLAKMAENGAALVETARVANDNRATINANSERIRALEIQSGRFEERLQAQRP